MDKINFPYSSILLGGAHFVYACYIEPFLESREKVIDEMLSQFGLTFLDLSGKNQKANENAVPPPTQQLKEE